MSAETHPDFSAALAAAREAHPEATHYGLTRIPASGPPSWRKARRYPVDEEPRKPPEAGAIYLFDSEDGKPLRPDGKKTPAVWRFEPQTEPEEEAEPEPEPASPEEDAALAQADGEVLGALRPSELNEATMGSWIQYLTVRQAMAQGGAQAGQIRETGKVISLLCGELQASHGREKELRAELREVLKEQKEEQQEGRGEKMLYAVVQAFGPFGAEVLRDWAAQKRADRQERAGGGPAKLPAKETPPAKGKGAKGGKGKKGAALPPADPESLIAAITSNPGALADLIADPRVAAALKERGLAP